jgi:hypothetical protein
MMRRQGSYLLFGGVRGRDRRRARSASAIVRQFSQRASKLLSSS